MSRPVRYWTCILCGPPDFEGRPHPRTGVAQCPACGTVRNDRILEIETIHLLVERDDGPIPGSGGSRWQVACVPERPYLARWNGGRAPETFEDLEDYNLPDAIERFHATGAPTVANCQACRQTKEWAELMERGGNKLPPHEQGGLRIAGLPGGMPDGWQDSMKQTARPEPATTRPAQRPAQPAPTADVLQRMTKMTVELNEDDCPGC